MTDIQAMTNQQLGQHLIDYYPYNKSGVLNKVIIEAAERLVNTPATRPEPSRLEIAAMMMESILSSGDLGGVDLTAAQCADVLGVEKYYNSKHYPQLCALYAVKFADALLAAAKGGE